MFLLVKRTGWCERAMFFCWKKIKVTRRKKVFSLSFAELTNPLVPVPSFSGVVDKVAFLLRLISPLVLWTTPLCLPEKTLSTIPPPSLSPSQSSSFLRVLVWSHCFFSVLFFFFFYCPPYSLFTENWLRGYHFTENNLSSPVIPPILNKINIFLCLFAYSAYCLSRIQYCGPLPY